MITDLFIPATNKSPEIRLSAKGKITISGRCIPYEPDEFFAPVTDWISNYCMDPANETIIDISIEYTNGTNSRRLNHLLVKLKEVTVRGNKMLVNFTYEADDENMQDYGHYLQDLLKIPFNMISVEKLALPVTVNASPHKSSELSAG